MSYTFIKKLINVFLLFSILLSYDYSEINQAETIIYECVDIRDRDNSKDCLSGKCKGPWYIKYCPKIDSEISSYSELRYPDGDINIPKIPVSVKHGIVNEHFFKIANFKKDQSDKALFKISTKHKVQPGIPTWARFAIVGLGLAAFPEFDWISAIATSGYTDATSGTAFTKFLDKVLLAGMISGGFIPDQVNSKLSLRKNYYSKKIINSEYTIYDSNNHKLETIKFRNVSSRGSLYNLENVIWTGISTAIYGIGPPVVLVAGLSGGFKFDYKPQQTENTEYVKETIENINFDKLKTLIKKNENLENYFSLLTKQDDYYKPFKKDDLDYELAKNLNTIGKPKGEFENSIDYQKRQKKEDLSRRAFFSNYQQQLAERKEKNEVKKIKIKREMEAIIDKISFERSYDYSISQYDADRQTFTFTIPSENITKKLVVPINKAEKFKSNINDYKIIKVIKPTLDGKWIEDYDDLALINKKNNEILSWEGAVPTFAINPVSNPPSLEADLKLVEPSGEGYLDAEEVANLIVTLKNNGQGEAKSIRISMSQEAGPMLYSDVSALINSIPPGESRTENFQIVVPENVKHGEVNYSITFLESQGYEPSPLNFNAEVRALRKPKIELVDFGFIDQNGDGKVQKGESADITARIQNTGQGIAKNIKAKIIQDKVKNIFLHPDSQETFEISSLLPGEYSDLTFTLLTNNRVDDIIDIEIDIDELRSKFSVTEILTLEIDKRQAMLKQISFQGTQNDVAIINPSKLKVDIEENIPVSKNINENALAIIFGIENYKNVSNVSFARRDATLMKEYMIKTLGIPSDKIYFKLDDDVGKAQFDKVFSERGWIDKRIIEDKTELFVFYAGHGAPSYEKNKSFLIPYDGDPNYASQTGYSLDDLYKNLSNFRTKSTTIFLDACFSGANRDSEALLANARPIFIEFESDFAQNITVFSAASGNEISSAWEEKKHGLFSYFLMKGIKGAADLNSNGELTIDELGQYLELNVSQTAGTIDREQNPILNSPNKDRVLTKYD
tara:strand:+ start:1607 stop:4657 length:3051 start_codon:yes stop_codon:yes gene_type:complete